MYVVLVIGSVCIAACKTEPDDGRGEGVAQIVEGSYELVTIDGGRLPFAVNGAQTVFGSTISIVADSITFTSVSRLISVTDTFTTVGLVRVDSTTALGQTWINLDPISPIASLSRDTLRVRFRSGDWVYVRRLKIAKE
jgi:hypothetical protein